MSAPKHMEGIFAVVVVAGVVIAALPGSSATPAPQALAAARTMPVVVVTGKRMTASEKRQPVPIDTLISGATKGT